MSIDPGKAGMGYAVWTEKEWKKCGGLAAAGVLSPRKQKDAVEEWVRGSLEIVERLKVVMEQWNLSHVYCEQPRFFGSLRGEAVARSGALVKLAVTAGAIAHMSVCQGADFMFVRVEDWMGQLPEQIVQERIVRALGAGATGGLRSHAWDAVGIGLYAKGFF